MADTMQVVRWALAQGCALRPATAIADPVEALDGTAHARTCSRYLGRPGAGFGIFGDICVTSYTSATVPKRLKRARGCNYPSDGFELSREFAAVGGIDGLMAMCGRCPANTLRDRPAGCAGTLYQSPESLETQEQLEAIVSRLGLENAVDDAFPRTRPLWYGLWARSPLSAPAVELLGTIIGEMLAEDTAELQAKGQPDDRHLHELRMFVGATQVARRHGLALHVSLAPPGHVDLGFYTVFPHCPFCKAEAGVQRWRRQYPTQLYTCHACGTAYPPAETASSEREEYDREELREQLGRERFVEFAKAYLMAQGLAERDAADIVAETERAEEERQAKWALERARDAREQRYVRRVLYAGLHPIHDDEEDDGEDGPELFVPSEFAELLNRCRELGVGVGFMYHRSQKEELDRWTSSRIRDPLAQLAQWQQEGCNERFGAAFNVPDELLRGFDSNG